MIVLHKPPPPFAAGLRYVETYFSSQGDVNGDVCDLEFAILASPMADAVPVSLASTYIVDLARPVEAILAGLDKQTQYEIRRCMKQEEGAFFWAQPTTAQIAVFLDLLERFHRDEKGIDINMEFYRPIHHDMQRAGAMFYTYAFVDGAPAVYHAYLFDGGRARLFNSFSFYRGASPAQRQKLGRVNRALRYHDMCLFRGLGGGQDDLGGCDPQQRCPLNRFKEEFGGVLVHEYHYYVPHTASGYAAIDRARAAAPQAA